MAADLFEKENIFCVVGATNNSEKYGSKVFLDLKNAGYNVIAINTRADGKEIHGTPSYESLTAFLARIRQLFNEAKMQETIAKIVLVLVVPPAAAFSVVKEAHMLSIRRAWFQPGAEGDDAIAFCKENGWEIIHDQCIMVQRPK